MEKELKIVIDFISYDADKDYKNHYALWAIKESPLELSISNLNCI